jgi:ubiquinol-cytochrome c reductase cytochrome c1 subunit
LIAFRNLVNVSHTEEEVREIAAEYEVEDGPNELGEMYKRPARVRSRIGFILFNFRGS